MLNTIRLLLLLFFTLPLLSQNNTIEVTYVKAYKNYKDTTSIVPKILKNLEYQLICNTNEARFEYISNMSNDGDNTNRRFIGKGGGKGVYYKKLSESLNIRKVDFFEQTFYIKVDNDKFKWELHKSETKKILGYDCFMATGTYSELDHLKNKTITHKVVAWYAPSLPIPFGPSGYDGLPGLVLQSYSGSFLFIAKDIKRHKERKKIEEVKPKNTIDEKEFNKVLFKNLMKLKNNN